MELAYIGIIELDWEDFEGVASLAGLFGITDLEDMCIEFMQPR